MTARTLTMIPGVGWVLNLVVSISLAVPFWFCWTVCDIGKDYFYFLPEVYHEIGFWASVGLFMVITILKIVMVPKLANVSNDSTSRSEYKPSPPGPEEPKPVTHHILN